MKRLLLCLVLLICATPSAAAPSSDARANYGGKCRTEDAVYVEGNQWWWFKMGRGIPDAGWKYGGVAARINSDQIIIKDSVYTRIGSSRDNCIGY